MRRTMSWTWVLAALFVAAPLPLAGQQFNGTGQTATSLFALPEGLSVFELEHRADAGEFVVRLMDGQGQLIDELARATGRFGGSKAVRIPRGGEYLLDVTATGPWVVRRRAAGTGGDPASPAFQQGREAGIAAASAEGGMGGWFARGVAGGLLGGPFGMGITAGMATRSRIDVPEPSVGGTLDLVYTDGFRAGFEERIRSRRRKSAFVGGLVGTGILAAALISILDIAGAGEGSGSRPPGPPGSQQARIPS